MCIQHIHLFLLYKLPPNVIQTTEGRKDFENIKDVSEIFRFAQQHVFASL